MKFTQNVKRGVAMLLTLAMLVSYGNFGLFTGADAASDDHSDHLHATLGQVLIDNLDNLTAQQEYLLKNGYLVADKQYHYAPPAEAADLVVVDSEGKTITAKPYTDSEGNVWIPTEFKLTGDADAEIETGALVADGEVYTGSYTATERNFSVHITYAFVLNLSAEEKEAIKAMVNAGAALNADLDILKYLDDVSVLDDIDEATRAKILDMVGGVDPNAELVLKALTMELDRLGGQSAVDMLASLAKDGLYLPVLEEDGEGNLTVNEQGVFISLGDKDSAAYLGALSLKQQQDAQSALNLAKVLDDYIELSDLALLALHADKVEAALQGNYAELNDVSVALKVIQPKINQYLDETVPGIYSTVFDTINDALASVSEYLEEYGIDSTVNSTEEFSNLVADLKGAYADALAQINEKLAGTAYDKNGAEAGAGISTPESIAALKVQLEKDYADNISEINKLLSEYGYKGAPVTDSASLSGPITWADGEYAAGLAELNQLLTDNGYTGRPVTDSKSISRPIVWLEDEIFAGLDTINGLLTDNGYTGAEVKDSAGMDAPIAWLDSQYAEAISKINDEVVKKLRDEMDIELEDVASSADIDDVVKALEDLRIELLKQANDAAAENNINVSITDEAGVDELIKELTFMSAFGGQKVKEALELAKQLKEALERIAELKEALAEAKTALEKAEEAKPKLAEAKDTLAKAEEAMDALYEAQELLVMFEQAQEKIPEVKEKMELAEFAIDALGAMLQLNDAIIKLDEVDALLGEMEDGVAQLEEQKENLKLLIIIMDGFANTTKPVLEAFENDSFNTPKLLKGGLSAETYALIELAIADAAPYTGEIPDVLTVAEADVKVNVAKFDIKIQYQASVVDPTKTDSLDTVQLPVYEDTITLPGGATCAEIKAEIDASGLFGNALAQWGIDVSKFDIQAQELADDFVLTEDLVYTVTVTPKTYKLTLSFGANEETVLDVPYGYRYTAPVHSDEAMEYIYTVVTTEAAEMEQGEVLTVTENTTIIRGEGKKAERVDLLGLVAKTLESDANIQNILTSSALKLSHTFSMRMPGKEQVSVVFNTEKQVTVISAPNYASRLDDLTWVATSVTVDGVTYPMVNGVYETAESFKLADVHYQLVMNPDAMGFTSVELLNAMNTPYKLASEYHAQKATLDKLVELMPLLKKLNDEDNIITSPASMTLREALGMIEHLQASYGFSVETIAAGKALYKLIPAKGHVALYDTMELYTHGGMYHYYKNEALYKNQITQLDDILKILVNDPEFMKLVHDASHGLFEEIKDTMDSAADVMNNVGVDYSKIDVADENLRTLLNLLETSRPSLYNRVPAEFTWQEDVHATGLGYTNVIMNVSFGGVTYTEDHVEATGTTLTVDQLLAWAEAMIADQNIGPEYPEFFTVRNDFTDMPLTGAPVEFHYTWDVNNYEIVVDGTDVVVGNINYNYMHLDLPAHTEEGMRYDYKIGDLTVDAGAYELTVDQFKELVAGTIKVTRTEINVEQELQQMQEDMLVDFVNHMEGAGIVTKDENGKYAVIFRVDYADVVDSFTRFGMGLFMGSYDHIGMDHHVFYGEGQYYFQALIDAMLHSGAGTHTILEQINQDGTLKHLDLPGATVITDYNYPTIGAEIMHSTAYFEKDGETLEADFYITLDGTPAEMKALRDRVVLIDKYLQVTFENGEAIAHLTLPEPVYAAYVAALVATGKIDLRHVNDLDTQVALAFLVEMLNPMLDKDTADWGAIENTGSMLTGGVGIDRIENAYENLIDRAAVDKIETVYEIITGAYDSEKVVYSDKSVYVPLENIRVKEFLDKVQVKLTDFAQNKDDKVNIDLSKIVYEYNSGVSVNLVGHLENMDIDYAALYVDVKADGLTKKAGVATAAELPEIAKTANLIVLLDDVNGDLVLNGNTISIKGKTLELPVLVDLNGKTVNGSIAASGRTIIIDNAYQSNVAPVGTVTGSVTGATVISGTYLTDVSACLPDGYVQEANGAVHHKLFTVEDDGANNLTLTLNADYDDLLEMIDVKGLLGVALDATAELALNNYIYSSLYLDGKQVFDFQVEDIVGIIGNDGKKQAAIDTLKSWASKEDLKYILKDVLNAVSDYDALYEALKDGGDGVIYQVDTLVTPYDITTEKIDNDGNPYYTVNVGGGKAKTGSLTVVVVGDMRLDLLLQAKALKDIVQNNVSVEITIDDASAGLEDKTVNITGDFAGELVVDLRDNPEYVIMTAVILADGNPAIRDEMVAAINAYYADNSMEELEKVFDSLTAAQIIAGWNKVVRGEDFFTGMVNNLALSEEAKAEILAVTDDEMLGFQLTVEIGAAILRKLGYDGNGRTLGSFSKPDGESGDNYYGIAKSKEFLGEKTVIKGYGVNYDVNIENVGFKLFLFHTHNWDNGVETVAPDCENEGEMLYTCTDCGHTKTEKIPALGHTYGDLIAEKPASCTETGLKAHYFCSVCEKYFDESKNEVAYEDLIIPYAHNYGELVEEKPATCTEPGLKAHYYCDACGKYFDENKNEVAYEDLIIPAGHEFADLIKEKPATCTEEGLKAHYYCSGCDKYFDENKNEVAYEDLIIPVKDHNYGALIEEKPATCTEEGLKAHYYCSGCGKYFDENKNEVAYEDLIIPVKDHNYGALIEEKPATCTEEGLKAHYYDADCGKYFDENKNEVAYEDLIIPVKDHNYGELIEEKPATCTEEGLKAHYYDADCDKYFDENKNEVAYEDLIIPVKDHNYGELIEEKPATCTEEGLKAYYYDADCGKYFDENKNEVAYEDLIIPVKDHNYGDLIPEVPAQVGVPGLKAHYYDAECDQYFDKNKNPVEYEDLIIPALPDVGVDAPVLEEVVVTPDDGIYGGKVLNEDGIKYLIVDADAREGLTLAQLKAMFPAIANNVDCEKITSVTDINGEPVATEDADMLATGYTVTFTATNEAGSDTATYILVLLGDINCDGKNTSSDAAEIKQYKLDNEPFGTRAQELAADVNCDGNISSSDANTIKLKVLHSANSDYAYVTRLTTLAD